MKHKLIFLFLAILLLMDISCFAQTETKDKGYRYIIQYQARDFEPNPGSYTIIIDQFGKIIKAFPKNHNPFHDPNFLNKFELPLIMRFKKNYYLTDRNGATIEFDNRYKKLFYFGDYRSSEVLIEGITSIRDKTKNEYLNEQLNVVLKRNEFDYLTRFTDNVAIVLRKGKTTYELINTSGQTIAQLGDTEDIYKINPSKGGYMRVERYDGSCYFLDHKGKIVLDVNEALEKHPLYLYQTVKSVFNVSDHTVLLTFNEHKKNYRRILYLKLNGEILFQTEIESQENPHVFKHKFAVIPSYKNTMNEDVELSRKENGEIPGSIVRESNNYYIDTLGNRYYGDEMANIQQNKLGVQKGDLLGLNKGIYNIKTAKMIFNKKGNILERDENYRTTYKRKERISFFDENIVITISEEYLPPNITQFITVYDYQGHVLWTEGPSRK